jgi:hypothetical protein
MEDPKCQIPNSKLQMTNDECGKWKAGGLVAIRCTSGARVVWTGSGATSLQWGRVPT